MIALGRLGDAHEVARAIEFLLHPDSCYITGAHAWSHLCMSSVSYPCAMCTLWGAEEAWLEHTEVVPL